jgi:hypothetical protein
MRRPRYVRLRSQRSGAPSYASDSPATCGWGGGVCVCGGGGGRGGGGGGAPCAWRCGGVACGRQARKVCGAGRRMCVRVCPSRGAGWRGARHAAQRLQTPRCIPPPTPRTPSAAHSCGLVRVAALEERAALEGARARVAPQPHRVERHARLPEEAHDRVQAGKHCVCVCVRACMCVCVCVCCVVCGDDKKGWRGLLCADHARAPARQCWPLMLQQPRSPTSPLNPRSRPSLISLTWKGPHVERALVHQLARLGLRGDGRHTLDLV